MGKFVDLTGETFGRLTVIEQAGRRGGQIAWLCQCECGNTTIVRGSNLKCGHTKTCGCLAKEAASKRLTHGMSYSKEYRSWENMNARCYNPSKKRFEHYGGRGIKVCDEWKNSFETFYRDMGARPEGTSLDRIDSDGNYEPSNCRWATYKEQANNRRNTLTLTYLGHTGAIAYFAEKYNILHNTLYYRIKVLNWPVEKALTTPIRGRSNAHSAHQ